MPRARAKPPSPQGLRIRLIFGNGTMLGPGKADLLESIRETGSISAAGRRLRMSYKRAWMLVDTLNAMFGPLVESSRGGSEHGGAKLTEAGERVLALYRSLTAEADAATAAETEALKALHVDMSGEK
jgi:molybdate transport system regulatory protein